MKEQLKALADSVEQEGFQPWNTEVAYLLRQIAEALPEPVLWVGDDALSRAIDSEDPCNAYRYKARRRELPLYTSAQLAAAVLKAKGEEQDRCCGLVFGNCSSDNEAQRIADAIRAWG